MADVINDLRNRVAVLEERVRVLEDALAPASVVIPLEWGLSQREACIFAHLTTRDLVTRDSIFAALYSHLPIDDEPAAKIVDVFLCAIRKKLSRFGVQIHTVRGRGFALAGRRTYISGAQ